IPAWRGPTDGRVRIMSPYRARGVRVRFLFCASLQEGEFPGPGAIDPLLGEERRQALGLSALRRRDPADEARYLSHACVSPPTRPPDPSAKPGPLQAEPVLKELAAREPLSANALEGWLSCPYRWFVDHELRPERLERESDPLWLGSVVHDALEQLYKENPGGDS